MNRYDAARQDLKQYLLNLPYHQGNSWSTDAENELLTSLFYIASGGNNPSSLRLLFPHGPPQNGRPWNLRKAQGAVDGSEYSEGARGRRCGHVFENSEATYYCRTCTTDDTCVLCTRCFHASDHDGHHVVVSLSLGGGGCCDCGDPEAWARPVICTIHTEHVADHSTSTMLGPRDSSVPQEFRESIEGTISAALDYVIDIFSCSSEAMKVPTNNTVESILKDEQMSRLEGSYGQVAGPAQDRDFVLMLWNDEKHTVDEVEEQVAKAARKSRSYGKRVAREVDSVGRCLISKSRDVADLVQQARILSQIKLTTTIRSSQDNFRELMCATIIDWLNDIAGCSVGEDHRFLLDTVCKQLLQPWTIGSKAHNLPIAQGGFQNHAASDDRLVVAHRAQARRQIQRRLARWQQQARELENATAHANTTNDDEDTDGDEDADVGEGELAEGDVMDLDQEIVLTIDDEPVNMNALFAINGIGEQAQSEESDEDYAVPMEQQADPNRLFTDVPHLRRPQARRRVSAPAYWTSTKPTPRDLSCSVEMDLTQRVRVDFLVFYDMRMWKNLRQTLRHLYISTLVTVPEYKRVLSVRFAALYTHLSQLYLSADREADQSIIYLSLQMLTTPSIAQEIVVHNNFLTRLLAILYTFLTTHSVGEPKDVDTTASISFESNTLSNRRFHHLFQDMRYLLEVAGVREYIRTTSDILPQFVDFAKLFQGICPSVRAVGEHVEYESDAWAMAGVLTRDVSRLSKQFCDCFAWSRSMDPSSILRAIRQAARAATINALGAERIRFDTAEMKHYTKFKQLRSMGGVPSSDSCYEPIVDCEVEKVSISLWHALHYILSWLIDAGKSMSSPQLANILAFEQQQLQVADPKTGQKPTIPDGDKELYMLAMFDIPLRVCAFLAQVRSGMWVRNGMAVRNQVEYYRSVYQRDLAHQRDIFLIQTAFVVCQPSRFLAMVIDRFTMSEWVYGNFAIKPGFEDHQMLDVAEEFLHLLIVVMSDRTLLQPQEDEPQMHIAISRRDMIHTLCFKPLTHSELNARLSEKVTDTNTFEEILAEVSDYRPPEGLADAGTLRLKDECYEVVDPYYAYYNKSQREEAETILRTRIAKQSSKPLEECFWEPHLPPIRSGIFSKISAFTQTPLFAQTVRSLLHYIERYDTYTTAIQGTRVETLLQVLLHLILLAAKEETSPLSQSFLVAACRVKTPIAFSAQSMASTSILQQLFVIHASPRFTASKAPVQYVLGRLRELSPQLFDEACSVDHTGLMQAALTTDLTVNNAAETSIKKREALSRQAKVLASFKKQQTDFLETQNIDWGDDVMSDSSDDFASVPELPLKTWEVPGGTCILCQDVTGEHKLHGTLAFVSESKVFRQTDLSDPSHIRDVQAMPLCLDQCIDRIRSTTSNGEGEVQPQARGKGFPPSQLRSGSVFSGCGHVMHWLCFHEYYLATQRRHIGQHARCHPEQIAKNEFVCPLCKALGNTFMPITWKAQPAMSVSTSPLVEFDVWMDSLGHELPLLTSGTAFVQAQSSQRAVECFKPNLLVKYRENGLVEPSSLMPLQELMKAQERVSHTLKTNALLDARPHVLAERELPLKVHTLDALIEAFGWTIGATEIAHRGFASSALWIDSISSHSITHLRTLGELITAHGVISKASGLQDLSIVPAMQLSASTHLKSLYPDFATTADLRPLFSHDIFTHLAQSTYYLGDLSIDQFTQHMRLALHAEIVKVTMATVLEPHEIETLADGIDSVPSIFNTSQQSERFSTLVQHIISSYNSIQAATTSTPGYEPLPRLDVTEDPNMRVDFDVVVRSMVFHYALTFVRKCLLLMHIRFGVDYSGCSRSPEVTELALLSKLLRLPSVDELVHYPYSDMSGKSPLYALTDHWITHWATDISKRQYYVKAVEGNKRHMKLQILLDRDWSIKIPHPTLYELVQLPRTHDTFNAIVLDGKCPKTGGPLQDPCLCLLCGEIFCGQAKCCSKGGQGGCTQHVRICGGSVGMFLNVKKCAVLFMHHRNGSFFTAPYLDRHGESDMGLKRHGQLFLNWKRYDRLFRDVWLGFQGGVSSAVARKLESEVNTGGWETL